MPLQEERPHYSYQTASATTFLPSLPQLTTDCEQRIEKIRVIYDEQKKNDLEYGAEYFNIDTDIDEHSKTDIHMNIDADAGTDVHIDTDADSETCIDKIMIRMLALILHLN